MPGSTEALALILYLLPGLVGVFVYEALSDRRESDGFTRIAAAILLTLVSVSLVQLVSPKPVLPAISDLKTAPPASVLGEFLALSLLPVFAIAIIIAAVLSWVANRGAGYRAIGWLGITRKTGRVDVWHQTFSTHRGYWLLVRFKNGHEYIGWPRFYSLSADPEPMLFLARAALRRPKPDGSYDERDVDGPGVLIPSMSDVECIEWLNGE